MLEEAKHELRAQLLGRRRAMPREEIQRVSQALTQALVQSPLWSQAGGVAAFVGVRREVDTRPLLEQVLAAGKQLWLPRVLGGGRMGFWPCTALEQLERGQMGLREPPMVGPACPALTPSHGIDLILVPGLAFDRLGARIGFGKGHYDRSLAAALAAGAPAAPRVGVCPAAFLAAPATIPLEAHDVPMTHVLSELGLERCELAQPSN